MLGIGPKIASADIDFTELLNPYITSQYPDSISDVAEIAGDLTKKRKDILESIHLNTSYDLVQPKIIEYVGIATHLGKRFNFSNASSNTTPETHIVVPFSYHEILQGYRPVTSYSIEFEIGCMLWNLAALASRSAVDAKAQDINRACTLFREASGILDYLSAQSYSMKLSSFSNDFSLSSISFFARLMQAQAQMCVFEKSLGVFSSTPEGQKKTMTPAMIAQFSAGVANIFKEAVDQSRQSPYLTGKGKSAFDWVLFAHYQFQVTLAAANMWHGRSKFEECSYGLEITYLRFAIQFMDAVASLDSKISSVVPEAVSNRVSMYGRIQNRLQSAISDNNKLYFDHVPNECPPVAPKILTPPIAFSTPQEINVYSKLVDVAIVRVARQIKEDISKYIYEKKNEVNALSSSLQNKLAELNLSTRVMDAASSEGGLPDSVWNDIREVRKMGGVIQLERMVDEVVMRGMKCNEMWEKAKDALDNEAKRDEEFRKVFPDRVGSIIESSALNQPYYSQLEAAFGVFINTMELDRKMKEDVARFKLTLTILSNTDAEITQIIKNLPSPNQGNENHQLSDLKRRIKIPLGELNEVANQREVLFTKLDAEFTTWSGELIPKLGSTGEQAEKERENITTQFKRLVDDRISVDQQAQYQLELFGSVNSLVEQLDHLEASLKSSVNPLPPLVIDLQKDLTDFLHVRDRALRGDRFYKDFMANVMEPRGTEVGDFCATRDMERQQVLQASYKSATNSAPNYVPSSYSSPPGPTHPHSGYGAPPHAFGAPPNAYGTPPVPQRPSGPGYSAPPNSNSGPYGGYPGQHSNFHYR